MVVDKLSTVLTITLAIIILNEPFWWLTFVAMAVILLGTFMMLYQQPKKENSDEKEIDCSTETDTKKRKSHGWLFFAILSLIFASFTSILAKIGMQNINSQLGTFLRTIIVLIMSFFIVLGKKQINGVKLLSKKNWVFIIISGILTGISWLCYYTAIQLGVVSVVVPIDKLSVLVTVVFCRILFKEKLNAVAVSGLILLVVGTLLLLI